MSEPATSPVRSDAGKAEAVRRTRARPLIGALYRRLRAILALIGLLLLIYHLGFGLDQIVSPSMAPALVGDEHLTGDWVLSERVSGWLGRGIRRWDVVRCTDHDGNVVMKRVVGLPGERVGMVDRQVTINGVAVPPPAGLEGLRYYPMGNVHEGRTVDCGEGYYLLGDDGTDSWDSRFQGPFERWRIWGRAWAIVSPGGRRGWLTP